MKGGTFGPGIRGVRAVLFLMSIFLRVIVTLTIKVAVLLRRTTMAAIWTRTPERLSPRVFGFARIEKPSVLVELVLSEADLRFLSFR